MGALMASGFFRRVKNPTATGTKIIKRDRHNSTYPIVGDKVCGVVTPFSVTSIGVPLATVNPQMQLNKLAHPQASAVKTVAMMPMVLFCI